MTDQTITLDEFREHFNDPVWRLSHLYKIITKDGSIITFKPNEAQASFLEAMWFRNVISKARQRGFSTLIQILMLDTALFQPNTKCKVIAQDKDAATEIFRDKLKFAYDNLHDSIREQFPLSKNSESSLIFTNGSSVAVTTSARSGTVQMLHVSEMGKISANYPKKAREIITGSIPAVPKEGLVFVESTSEGPYGEFYNIVKTAESLQHSDKKLTQLDYKLHFYSWHDAEEYQIDPEDVTITKEQEVYFDRLEQKLHIDISLPRRAWYVKTQASLGEELMRQEYPSTIDEAFSVSLEGTYYRLQFELARKEKRIGRVPYDDSLPVYTFWDIGQNDQTAIWCVQVDGKSYNVINYTEAVESTFNHFVAWLKETGYLFETHFLPHDATHKRQLGLRNMTAQEMIEELAPGWKTQIVPRIPSIITGINQARQVFKLCYFDEVHCALGLSRVELYKKEWDKSRACYRDTPRHDENSNGADAFRMFGQAVANKQITGVRVPKEEEFVSWRDRLNNINKSKRRNALGM